MFPPQRVLLVNPTHLGDIVISTSLLGVLKSVWPKAEVGFVTASWSQCVVRDHPLVVYTHTVDHWRMNREPVGLLEKVRRYRRTRRRALAEIRRIAYDVALHLNPGRIDLLDLSSKARIPVRAAFSKSLWAPFATVLADFPEPNLFRHHGDCQADLLRRLGVAEHHFAQRRSTLAPVTARGLLELSQLLAGGHRESASYVIIHPGAGAQYKELAPAFWREAASVLARERLVVFTGKGDRERQNIEQAMDGLPNCLNACDKLSWEGFVAAVSRAQMLYGVDSLAGHVAAALGTKSVNVYHGSAGVARWRPEGANATVWSSAVPCAPCHLKRGCAQMTCLRSIEPWQILDAAHARSAAR